MKDSCLFKLLLKHLFKQMQGVFPSVIRSDALTGVDQCSACISVQKKIWNEQLLIRWGLFFTLAKSGGAASLITLFSFELTAQKWNWWKSLVELLCRYSGHFRTGKSVVFCLACQWTTPIGMQVPSLIYILSITLQCVRHQFSFNYFRHIFRLFFFFTLTSRG